MTDRITDERLAEYNAWFADPNIEPVGYSRYELLQYLKAEREHSRKLEEAMREIKGKLMEPLGIATAAMSGVYVPLTDLENVD